MRCSNDIGSRIRYVRRLRKITQAQLAEMANMSTIGIRQYEECRRTPTAQGIRSVAVALNVSTDYLLFGNHREVDDPI